MRAWVQSAVLGVIVGLGWLAMPAHAESEQNEVDMLLAIARISEWMGEKQAYAYWTRMARHGRPPRRGASPEIVSCNACRACWRNAHIRRGSLRFHR